MSTYFSLNSWDKQKLNYFQMAIQGSKVIKRESIRVAGLHTRACFQEFFDRLVGRCLNAKTLLQISKRSPSQEKQVVDFEVSSPIASHCHPRGVGSASEQEEQTHEPGNIAE